MPAIERTTTPLRATDPAEWPGLMARAQAGDAAAYRRLLDGVTPYLRALARRALGGGADVEDAVQDILLTVHAIRHTYDSGRPFRPWLAGIARHRVIDRLRARGRILSREVTLAEDHAALADGSVPDPAHDHATLYAALATLPARQREALTAVKLREMSLAEASAATGLSTGALKVATHRGLAALRRLFGSRDGTA